MIISDIGKRLLEVRIDKGFSQKKFSENSSISQSFLCDVEQGKSVPSGDFLLSIYKCYRVDINWLLADVGQKYLEQPSSGRIINSSSGIRIKKIRKALNLTQKEISLKLGVTQGFFSSVESDRFSMGAEFLYELNRQFNVNINWLLAGEGAMFLTGAKPTTENSAAPDLCDVDQPSKDQAAEKLEFTPAEILALKSLLGSLGDPNMKAFFAAISKKTPEEIDALRILCDMLNKPYMKSIVTMADGMSDEDRNNLYGYIEEQKRRADTKRKLGGGGNGDLPEVKRA